MFADDPAARSAIVQEIKGDDTPVLQSVLQAGTRMLPAMSPSLGTGLVVLYHQLG